MKTSKNLTFIIILALLVSGLFSFIPTVDSATGPVTVSLTANPQNINKGEKTSLSWNSTNADFCVAYSGSRDWHGIRAVSGNETIVPQDTATYRITCSNNSGYSGTGQVTIKVGETAAGSSISVNITANPESIFRGEFTTLIWSSTNAVSCEATGGPWAGVKQTFGSESVSPSVTSYYTLRCNNSTGEFASDTQVIFVNQLGSPTPTIPSTGQFNVACVSDPSRATIGQTVTFAGAQSYGAEPATYRWSGDVSGNTQSVKTSFNAAGTKTVQLFVTDANGKTASATCSVEITQSTGIAGIFPIFRTTPMASKKLSPPTNLKPNGEELPAKTKEVALTWDKVKGAKFYAVRLEPENKTDERDSRNNCPNNPHYLCVNNLAETSIKVSVKAGDTYQWWVHAVDANGVFSDPAFAKFSVKTKETGLRDNFLANILGGFSEIGILSLILIILAFIIGYAIGKGRKSSLNL
ncbi:MAG: PKD domain-containing protein [Patescibacteria group bacterium]